MASDPFDTTHFGFKDVIVTEKTQLVNDVFDSVALKYDVMNDLMSLGLHRFWKQFLISQASLRKGDKVLDIAAGTGDLSLRLAKEVGNHGKVIMTDINAEMLAIGRDKLIDKNLFDRVDCVIADAEQLPFSSNSFDCTTIAFGLRNVTRKERALASMFKVPKPGKQVWILEFSHPQNKYLYKLYDLYSFGIIPKLGEMVVNDASSYRYLVESIRKHPDQLQLKAMMEKVGFEDVEHINLHNGIVALHTGTKY